MARVTIDGRAYDADPGKNMLEVCLGLGFDLPYFCWHPALGSVGACRQCAVAQYAEEDDARGRIVMACMTPAAEGTRISIDDPAAKEFRAAVIEWLMLNHPHDCPVCDEGGECHLQDMTVMTGHVVRRDRFPKRTHTNQDLGPFINHEMNRCIECYRCVRYYRDYAGGHDLGAFAAHDHVYFGRAEDGPLESEFAGNLVEICPTGVFTDKTLRHHFARKWDLEMAPSVCVHCGVGCNTTPGARAGELRRVLNRYNHEVNGYFLCDRGRFGYGFNGIEERIPAPFSRLTRTHPTMAVSRRAALDQTAQIIARSRVIGIGSPRASLESNYVLRALVGQERFFIGVGNREHALLIAAVDLLRRPPAPPASVLDVERADAALVLGEDVACTAPRIALALRQSVRNAPMAIADRLQIPRWNDAATRNAIQDARGSLSIVTPAPTRLDDVATRAHRASPEDIARLGFMIARAIDDRLPQVRDRTSLEESVSRAIASELICAGRPLVVFGTSLESMALFEAAISIARALRERGVEGARLVCAVREANSIGLAALGGPSLDDAFACMREGEVDAVVVLENDLFRRAARSEAEAFLSRAKDVIVLDHLWTETATNADVALGVCTPFESSGTFVSCEGRAQRYFAATRPGREIEDSWRWLSRIAVEAGMPPGALTALDEVIAAIARDHPDLSRIVDAAPGAGYRIHGQRIAREPHRSSGRTALSAHVCVQEPRPLPDPDSPLAFSMEGTPLQPPAPLLPFIWSPGWSSVQAINKFQEEIGGPMRGGDAGVPLFDPQPPKARSAAQIPWRSSPRTAIRAGKVASIELLLLPKLQVFGSEELSARSPAVKQLIARPGLWMSAVDAAAVGLDGDVRARVEVDARAVEMEVQVDPRLPPGVALLAGSEGVLELYSPAIGVISTQGER
jgi:NADH-quinone oxidoreductase subunit G